MKHKSALTEIERLIIAAFALMATMLALVYMFYSLNEFKTFSSERQELLDYYSSDITAFLNQKDRTVREIITELASNSMLEADNPMTALMAKQNLNTKFNAILQQEVISTFLILDKDQTKITAYSGIVPMQDRNAISKYVRNREIPITCTGKQMYWEVFNTGSQYYLFESYEVNGYVTAVFCNVTELFYSDELMRSNKVLETGVVFDEDTVIGILKNDAIDYTEKDINEGSLQISSNDYVIQKSDILGTNVYAYQVLKRWEGLFFSDSISMPLIVISIFTVSAVILLIALRKKMHSGVIKPTKIMLEAMRELQTGNETFRIQSLPESREFFELSSSFNHMADEIVDLRIEQYEQKLLQLQSQIKTHFYLNAFTTIQSLTYQNRDDDIRKFVTYLSSYMRYMMQMNQRMVMLQNELSHIDNYFCMQQIRFPGSVSLTTDLEEGVENWKVPFLTVYTIAENTLKHAMSPEFTLNVTISAKRMGTANLKVSVTDNGPGFSQEALEKLKSGSISGQGKHIGILNIRSTLALLYGSDELLRVGNDPTTGSAVVEMVIPMRTLREMEV